MSRRIYMRHKSAHAILKMVERAWGKRLRIRRSDESYYDPSNGEIAVGPIPKFALIAGEYWPNCVAFHELGHAVIDRYWHKFDQTAFKRVFHGSPRFRYHEDVMPRIFGDVKRVMERPAVTWYGKTHPEEAWAEAFSWALANADDKDLSNDAIEQLAYADWVIDNLLNERKRWGRYIQPEIEFECPACTRALVLACRQPDATRGWEGDCPHCQGRFEVA